MIAQLINIEKRSFDFTNNENQRITGANYYLTFSRKDDNRISTLKTNQKGFEHWMQGLNVADAKKVWWEVEYVLASKGQGRSPEATITLMLKA